MAGNSIDGESMTEREKQLEMAAKNPDQIIETPEEIAERDRLKRLFRNSNPRPRWVDDYEAGWKAAKAYYNVQS